MNWKICKRGHERTPENSLLRPDGREECRPCHNERQKKHNHTAKQLRKRVAELESQLFELQRKNKQLTRQTITSKTI